ncbi:hypothetical protein OAM57_00305 [Flavobacteriaceae bacterium]|nr:hypothetical protein [Flavobacteriaceae bacterium]
MKFNVGYLILLSIFFPFVGFIPGIDTQPTFLLINFCLFFTQKLRNEAIIIGIFLALLVWIRLLFEIDQINYRYTATYIVMVGNVIFMINLFLQNKFKYLDNKIFITFFGIYIIVAFVQYFYPNFLTFLTPRGSVNSEMIALTGRGLKSLTNEPSHFGKIIVIFNILFFIINKNLKFKYSIILFLLNAFIPQSVYYLSIHIVVILLLYFNIKYISIIAFFFYLFINYYTKIISDSSRVYFLMSTIIDNSSLIMQQGAFGRLYNIPITINNFVENIELLGFGNASNVFYTNIQTFFGEFNYTAQNRNLGGYIELLLKMGILSFPIYLLYIYTLIKPLFKNFRLNFKIALCILILTINDGTVVNQLTLFLILFYYYYDNRSYSRSKT